MGMNPSDPRVQLGARGEFLGKEILKRMGFYVLSSSVLADGPAPLLTSHLKKNLISPDALAIKDGMSRWVDFKAKADWTEYRRKDYDEQTGIKESHYQNYLAVQNASGFECWLAFLHGNDTRMLMQSLSLLIPDHRHSTGGRMNYPTVYFRMCDFISVPLPECRLTDDFIIAAQNSLEKSMVDRKAYIDGLKRLPPRDVRNGDRWMPHHFSEDFNVSKFLA